MRWRSQWSDSLRFLTEGPALAVYLSVLHACYGSQVSKRLTFFFFLQTNREENILNEIILMYYSCQKKNTKMIHLEPLKPGDNPHARGAAPGELGMREPLYIPLRSTWLNRWYICMLICLISLLQMSYRHIKGLTLRHNDIGASDGAGGLMETWGSHSFKSSAGTFCTGCQEDTKASTVCSLNVLKHKLPFHSVFVYVFYCEVTAWIIDIYFFQIPMAICFLFPQHFPLRRVSLKQYE